jgi:hypothetical protein
MPADPFALITKSDEALIAKARKRGPKALQRITMAIAKRAVTTAREKDQRREKEMVDDQDRVWPPRFLRCLDAVTFLALVLKR